MIGLGSSTSGRLVQALRSPRNWLWSWILHALYQHRKLSLSSNEETIWHVYRKKSTMPEIFTTFRDFSVHITLTHTPLRPVTPSARLGSTTHASRWYQLDPDANYEQDLRVTFCPRVHIPGRYQRHLPRLDQEACKIVLGR